MRGAPLGPRGGLFLGDATPLSRRALQRAPGGSYARGRSPRPRPLRGSTYEPVEADTECLIGGCIPGVCDDLGVCSADTDGSLHAQDLTPEPDRDGGNDMKRSSRSGSTRGCLVSGLPVANRSIRTRGSELCSPSRLSHSPLPRPWWSAWCCPRAATLWGGRANGAVLATRHKRHQGAST